MPADPIQADDRDPLLYWDERGAPRSRRFGDIYFQPGDGARESRAVFLRGCGIPGLWRDRRRFTVAETGFGTGLNFLLTWEAWRQTRGPRQRLHYLAVERYPLSPAELQRALAPWPALAPLADRLERRYGHPSAGFERINFDRDRLSLTLLIGDAAEVLEQLEAVVDAWYLDGFAPRCNPGMWTAEVLAQLARLSADGARLATFTAAGSVRRGLEAAGFRVRKEPGFGEKKERLVGEFAGRAASACPGWCAPPAAVGTDGPVTVLGGGVAGRSIARALSRRDVPVDLIDAGGGASTNPAALVMPRLEAGWGNAGRLFWCAYRYALRHWQTSPEWRAQGALLLARTPAERERQQGIVDRRLLPAAAARPVSAGEAAELAGVPLTAGGLWFPEGGQVDGQAMSARVEPAVRVLTQRVHALDRGVDGWRAIDGDGGVLSGPGTLILATGADLDLRAAGYLPLERWHGTATAIAASHASSRLRVNLACGRYLTAASAGLSPRHWAGATFDREPPAGNPDSRDRANLDALDAAYPELVQLGSQAVLARWSGVRCATPDRLPAVGPLVDAGDFVERFSWLRHGRRAPRGEVRAPVPDGRYLLLALGARGFTTAPLLAEWLASLIYGDPWPLERELALAVHASRFLVRSLRRREL